MSSEVTKSDHYDSKYYDWQKSVGAFGGRANRFKFENTVRPSDILVDFGCGGGFLIANIECSEKIGIDPNQNVKNDVVRAGARYYPSVQSAIDDLGAGYADVIISNHALEHAHSPLLELRKLNTLLKPEGRIHFVVPFESIEMRWKPADKNNHLYTWSPMNLGNLFQEAGFEVERVEPIWHKWPPNYQKLAARSWRLFDVCARLWARLKPITSQVEVIAIKPGD